MAEPDASKLREWREAFHDAVLETDPKKMPQRVEAAESAIFFRLQVLSATSDQRDEYKAIDDALRMLRTIKKEKIHYPDSGGRWF